MRKLSVLTVCGVLLLCVSVSCGSGSSTESSASADTTVSPASSQSTGTTILTGKWKLNTSSIDSYEIFGEDGMVKETTDYSHFLSFSGGKVYVFGEEAEYSFDGKTLTVVQGGKEVYKLGKLSGGTDDQDINGSYKDLRGEDDTDKSGSYVTYYDFDGDKTTVSFGSNPYTVSGDKLTINYINGDNTESAEFSFSIDGNVLTVTDGKSKNTFERVE